MKLTLSFVITALCFVSPLLAQDVTPDWVNKVEVTAGNEEFDKVEHYAYSVLVFETSKSAIRKLVKEEVAARTDNSEKSGKNVEGQHVVLPGYEDKDVTVHAKADPIKGMKDVVKVSVAFIYQDQAVSPQTYPDADKSAQEMLYNFGVTLNRSVVAAQIIDAERELEDLTRKHDVLVKQRKGMDENIAKHNEKLEQLDADKVKLEGKMNVAQAEAAALEGAANSSNASEKDIKKYSKAKDKAIDAEQKYMMVDQEKAKIQTKIEQEQILIPQKEAEIAMFAEQMEAQTQLVAALNTKYDNVN